ncbi:nitroreductase family deazaflavin-dependent oxidoreductase [Mycobacterium sp. 1423905.2]|uniref:nitroreductase family deazaflavin-dependent oxidoreductase n=1 Tax=Mycobacterium sp. 1423905.2 TaxID=1856859 RepID=UPI0007FE04FD|nr:nitroreductase family deazaflavin-dependent oxidoreductase [Mycobacterium sp. 1423905.2]OBJ56638.1 nitroreductase [Mycobacterium sp. 1423905.2]
MSKIPLRKGALAGLVSSVATTVLKYMAKAQVAAFTLTDGRIGGNWRIGAGFRKPAPTMLLEHQGRKSGQVYTTPLVYLEDGDDLVIVASHGGLPKNPQWYHNLAAHPDTLVHLKGQRALPVTARPATSQERATLWPRLVDLYSDLARSQSWSQREFPVLILSRR